MYTETKLFPKDVVVQIGLHNTPVRLMLLLVIPILIDYISLAVFIKYENPVIFAMTSLE